MQLTLKNIKRIGSMKKRNPDTPSQIDAHKRDSLNKLVKYSAFAAILPSGLITPSRSSASLPILMALLEIALFVLPLLKSNNKKAPKTISYEDKMKNRGFYTLEEAIEYIDDERLLASISGLSYLHGDLINELLKYNQPALWVENRSGRNNGFLNKLYTITGNISENRYVGKMYFYNESLSNDNSGDGLLVREGITFRPDEEIKFSKNITLTPSVGPHRIYCDYRGGGESDIYTTDQNVYVSPKKWIEV